MSSSPPNTSIRSKNGCISCRIRRVKCDETKPHCNRCTASRRTCDGYLPEDANMTRRQLVEAVRSLNIVGPVADALARQSKSLSPARDMTPSLMTPPTPFSSRPSSPHDYVYFDYFRRATAPTTDMFIPSAFWEKDLLQLAHAEPAVWHATLALGALHRRWEVGAVGNEMQALVQKATLHYGKAMSLAKHLDSTSKVLALALPLVAAANLLGYWHDSHKHMIGAFTILSRETGRIKSPHHMLSTLTRLELLSLTYEDTGATYPFEKALAVRTLDQGIIKSDEPFESYPQAATMLYALLRKLFLYDIAIETGKIDLPTWQAVSRATIESTETFERKMAEFEARRTAPLSAPVSISMRIYHTMLRHAVTGFIFGPQTATDDSLGVYERITALTHAFMAHQPRKGFFELSLEPAVVLPLFDVGRSCRHPALRRHATELMRSMNRHEGMWRSDMSATGMVACMDIEEPRAGVRDEYELVASVTPNYAAMKSVQDEALALPWSYWSDGDWRPLPSHYSWDGITRIPEAHRIKGLMVSSRFEEREVDMRILMSSSDPNIRAEEQGNFIDMTVKY